MEALTVVDTDSFTDFVIKKNYKFFSNEEKAISFNYISPTDNVYLIRRSEKNDAIFVTYLINNSKEFEDIKKQLKLNNYFFEKSQTTKDGVFLNYQKVDNKFIASILIMKEFYKIYIFPL